MAEGKRVFFLFLYLVVYVAAEGRNNEKTRFSGSLHFGFAEEDDVARLNYFILYIIYIRMTETENFYHFTTVNGRAVQRSVW